MITPVGDFRQPLILALLKLNKQDIHAFTYDCPSGHSKAACNGYSDEANDMIGSILRMAFQLLLCSF